MHFLTKVHDVMTFEPVCTDPDTPIADIARLMDQHNCGEIPICSNERKVLGVITDRDIVVRCVAAGKNPADLTARDLMSAPVVTVHENDSLSKAFFLMEEKNVRRLPVIDPMNRLVGVISQVDIAARASEREAGRLLARRGRTEFVATPAP